MRIRKLHLAGFGKLRGEIEFAPDRCNLILAPNESGKSTLVAALITALYGHPSERRSKNLPIPSRDAFRPWRGGPYALTVEFSLGKEGYRLHRDLAGDHVELFHEATGREIAAEYRGEGGRPEILETLIGLEREDFARSALVMQEEVQAIREGDDITLRLQKFATSHGGDITAGEAVECLEDALTRYDGTRLASRGRVETEIARLQERLQQVRAGQEALDTAVGAAAQDLRLLEELGERERTLADDLHRLDYLRTRAILAEIGEQIDEQERAVRRLASLREERDALARDVAEFPLEMEGELSEIKGKIDELSSHLEDGRARYREEMEEPLTELEHPEEGIPEGLRTPEELARTESAAIRLREARRALAGAKQTVRRERRRLRSAGLELDEASALAERFRKLSPEDRLFLDTFRQRLREAGSAQVTPPEAGPEADSPGPQAAAPARRPVRGLLLSGAILLAAAAVTAAVLGGTLAGLALAAAAALGGLGLLAAGLVLRRRRARPVRRETPEEARRSLEDRADVLSRALGFANREAMLAPIDRLAEIRQATAHLQELMRRHADREEDHGRARQSAAEILARAGRDPDAGPPHPREVEALRDRLREGLRLERRREELGERGRRSEENLRRQEERLSGMRGRMEEIAGGAGITLPGATGDPGADAAAILREFSRSAEVARRLRHLEEELLPEAAAAVASEEWLARKRTELRTMEEVLHEIVRRGPLDPAPDPAHSSNHYVVEFKRVDDALRGVQRQRREAFGRVGDLVRRQREEGPVLAEERERLETTLARAERFAQAVRLAADVLTEISRESYQQWATALNDRSNRALGHLNPAYRDLRFDTDLSFTLEEAATGRRLSRDEVDVHLSAGARDQIYLAIRLAVSDYFSAGRARLPLILDDVLAGADDERFDRILEYLADRVSPRHQVILLSCQEERHRLWRERHPDLFDARVRTLSLPALGALEVGS